MRVRCNRLTHNSYRGAFVSETICLILRCSSGRRGFGSKQEIRAAYDLEREEQASTRKKAKTSKQARLVHEATA